jgi:hypothetical protein
MCELTRYKIADDEYLYNDPSHNQDTTESTLCQVEEENEKNLSTVTLWRNNFHTHMDIWMAKQFSQTGM